MNIPALPSGLHPEDYDRIEAAVMETVRGRWFLLEYARRQRAGEIDRLMRAIDRLERYAASCESAVSGPALAPPQDESAAAGGVETGRARDVAARARLLARALHERGLDEDLCADAHELAEAAGALIGEAGEETSLEAAEEAVASNPASIEPTLEDLQPLEAAEETQALDIEAANDDLAGDDASEREPAFEPVGLEPVELASSALEPRKPEPPVIAAAPQAPADPRLRALSRLDHLSSSEKLALFG